MHHKLGIGEAGEYDSTEGINTNAKSRQVDSEIEESNSFLIGQLIHFVIDRLVDSLTVYRLIDQH